MRGYHSHNDGLADPINLLAEAEANAQCNGAVAHPPREGRRLPHKHVSALLVITDRDLKAVPIGVRGEYRQKLVKLAGGCIKRIDITHGVLHVRVIVSGAVTEGDASHRLGHPWLNHGDKFGRKLPRRSSTVFDHLLDKLAHLSHPGANQT